jgi:hypothetical protein
LPNEPNILQDINAEKLGIDVIGLFSLSPIIRKNKLVCFPVF